MPNLLDQQPLVPPALRRFQAIKDQQEIQVRHNSALLCSKSDDCQVPNESHAIKSSWRRHPKSTVHGVVDQFGQLHEQKSGIDKLLSSVGNIFRRLSTQEVRTFRLLDSQSVDTDPDENRSSAQGCWSHMKGDKNSVDKADTGKEDLPVVMITTFTENIPSQKIQNGASSNFPDRANSKSHEGSILKSHKGAKSKSSDRGTSKSRDRSTPHEGSTSKSPEEAATKAYGHTLRRMIWTSTSSKKQVEIIEDEHKQSTNMMEEPGSFRENSNNTEAVRTSPKCNRQTQLSYSRHRKLNFSKIFRIKRNSGQKYSLVPHSSLGTEHDQPQALLCDPELDDNSLDSVDCKEVTDLEPMRLSSLSPSNASNITNQAQNNLTQLPGRENCQLKCTSNTIRELAGSSADDNFTVGLRVTTSRSNMASPGESLHTTLSDFNLAKCEHLAGSTDELTQLIWAAF